MRLVALLAIYAMLMLAGNMARADEDCTVYVEWTDSWCECMDRAGYFNNE